MTDDWSSPQHILVILAHPDDPEFFCGAALARWARAGHKITYCLLTCGDKGFNPDTHPNMTPETLCAIRHDREDGYLVPDLTLRRDIVRLIRREKPDILVTCDPQNLFAVYGLNHPDHRAAGQAVLDAVFPAAGSRVFFPELLAEGLEPHMPREVWCSLTSQPNTVLDVTDTWDIKLAALLNHKSQIGDAEKFKERMKSRHTESSTDEDPRYEEKFRVVKYV
jgi:LmbE family N-acetylglucosaminyl deacetylase